MKKFLTILVLGLLLTTPSQADDVKDLEIEGMSIGDSLLDYMDESKMYFKFLYKDKSFKTTYFDKTKIFDDIQISVKSDDNNYIIHNISAKLYYKKNYNECLIKKKEIIKEFKSVISSDIPTQAEDNIKRKSDPTGNSTMSYYAFYFDNGAMAQVFCTDWSDELFKTKQYIDELKAALYSKEFSSFLDSN